MHYKYLSYFKIYLITVLFFAIIWLYLKHSVGNDSTISEWIINYQGGFVRRGLPGELAFHLASFFDIKLRTVILFFQIGFYSLYIFLIYNFFKNIKFNEIILFAVFTPIFIIYHVAELEVLARKEIFLFLGYLWFYNISQRKNNYNYTLLWIVFVLPIVSVLYEPSIFYYSFFAATLILKIRNLNLIKISLIVFLVFLPSLIVSWITATAGIITTEGFDLMRNSLMNNFGEECYRSCEVMSSLREPSVHLQQTFDKLTEGKNTVFIYLFRYFMILLVGFFPLLILLKFSSLKIKFLNFKKLIWPFVILNITVIFHWLMFIDWGRAVNITYVSSLLFFVYLLKNDYISVNFKEINKLVNKYLSKFIKFTFFKSKKFLLTFLFIIYAFGWSPPTLLSADVNSFPGYRIPYKTSKILYLNYFKD